MHGTRVRGIANDRSPTHPVPGVLLAQVRSRARGVTVTLGPSCRQRRPVHSTGDTCPSLEVQLFVPDSVWKTSFMTVVTD